jgi:uncharacterized protein YkwD
LALSRRAKGRTPEAKVSRAIQTYTRAKRSVLRACLVFVPVVVALLVALLVVNATAAPTAASVMTTNVAAAPPAAGPTESTTARAPVAPELTMPAGPDVEYSAVELEFAQLLNDYRASKGLEPLMLSDVLTVACDRHSSDMAKYGFMNHYTGYYRTSAGKDRALKGTNSDYFATGTDPAERMIACGYDYSTSMGENLAGGYKTAAEALMGFKASSTHNANLLSADYKVIGIALVYDSDSEYGYYLTTDFGGYVDTTAHAVATFVASMN